jgi:dTDP-4-dehydrorhamnose 3,5-epimerase
MEFEHNYGGIEGLVVITPKVFGDERGFFKETFNEKEFKEHSIDIHWVQANHSRSSKGVLRGLHWQKEPHAQDKLVRATTGAVLDVAVDIRKDSPTFGKYAAVELTEENHKMFLVPRGFAHGFVALTDIVDFEYMVGGGTYNKESEGAIIWNDPDIGIEWGVKNPLVSEKDGNAPRFKDVPKSDLF